MDTAIKWKGVSSSVHHRGGLKNVAQRINLRPYHNILNMSNISSTQEELCCRREKRRQEEKSRRRLSMQGGCTHHACMRKKEKWPQLSWSAIAPWDLGKTAWGNQPHCLVAQDPARRDVTWSMVAWMIPYGLFHAIVTVSRHPSVHCIRLIFMQTSYSPSLVYFDITHALDQCNLFWACNMSTWTSLITTWNSLWETCYTLSIEIYV